MEVHGSDDEVPDSSDCQGSPRKRNKRNSKTLESPFLQRHPKYDNAKQGHCVRDRVCQKSCIYEGLEENEKLEASGGPWHNVNDNRIPEQSFGGSGAFSPNKVRFMLNPSAWFPNMHLSESSDEAYNSGMSSGRIQRSTSSEYPGDQLQLQRVSFRRQRSSSSSHVSKSEKRTSRSSKVRSIHGDISKEICLGNKQLTVYSDLDPDKVKDNPSCHCTACCHCHGSGQGKGCSHHQVVCEILSNSSSEIAPSSSLHENDFNLPSPTFISSWGYFSKSKKSHYKYRRSDYSSDSDDDVPLKGSQINADIAQKSYLPMTKPFCLNSTNGVKGREKNENSKEVAQIPCMALNEGVKPLDFKERMKTIVEWFTEFSDEQKNIFIKEILNGCDLPQLHLLSVKMEANLHNGCPPNCQDIITWLPSNLATKIMSYLDPVSLCRASQVCKVWYQLASDLTFWRRFCCEPKWRLSKAAEHKQVISHMTHEGSIQWKKVFAERFRLRNNWLSGRCTVRTFEGHSQGISCVQFDDTRIVSGSSDKTIKVWNIRTNAQWSVQTLVGHSGTVRCLHLEGNRLVSGSTDKTIKVWDLSTQESWSSIACKVTMTGHLDTVRCLQVDDIKVISGSYDKTLKVWDILTGQCQRTLRGHQAAVLCVHFNDTKIVSGSCDKTIKVWNYEGECVMTLTGHQDAVTCLQFDATRVISGSLDCNLKFWDIHSGECISTIDWKASEGHTGVVRCLQADSWRLVSASDDKTIKVWNLETGKRLITLRNHTDGVTCLQFNDFIIVSGSYDKTVKLWDFSCC